MELKTKYFFCSYLYLYIVSICLLIRVIMEKNVNFILIFCVWMFSTPFFIILLFKKHYFLASIALFMFNIYISIAMIEFLIETRNEFTCVLFCILIFSTLSIDNFSTILYEKFRILIISIYLTIRLYTYSIDNIYLMVLIFIYQIISILVLYLNQKENEFLLQKLKILEYYINLYPSMTFIIQTSIQKLSNFNIIFSNKAASNELKSIENTTLEQYLKNISINSSDILDKESKPSYSPGSSHYKYGSLHDYILRIHQNHGKVSTNTLKCQKFFASYKKSLSKKMKLRIVLISFEIDNHLSYLLSMEDMHLEDEIKQLKEIDIYKDQMLASITHDLRSPLSSVLTLIENAREIIDSHERKQSLDYALHNGELLMNLINDILDYSQMKRGKFRLIYTHFSLDQLLNEVLNLMKIQAEIKNIKLTIENSIEGSLILFSDLRRIKQILINLIGNSLKFTITGKIVIKTTLSPNSNIIKFEVIDSGIGMKPEVISKLGTPFASFNGNGLRNPEGVGLGLYICKTLIGQLGPYEDLFISSHLGEGSKFGFLIFIINDKKGQKFLTADQLENVSFNEIKLIGKNNKYDSKEFSGFFSKEFCYSDFEEKKNLESLKIKNRSESKLEKNKTIIVENNNSEDVLRPAAKKKSIFFNNNITHETSLQEMVMKKKKIYIMIVDDDPFILYIMRGYIKKIAENKNLNFSIEHEEAVNGVQATELFKKKNFVGAFWPFSIIFMDCQMPIQSGFETAEIITKMIKDEGFINCKIIGCSALIGSNEEQKGLESGMSLFVHKPLTLDQFIDIITKELIQI